jgi:hypothetical protein
VFRKSVYSLKLNHCNHYYNENLISTCFMNTFHAKFLSLTFGLAKSRNHKYHKKQSSKNPRIFLHIEMNLLTIAMKLSKEKEPLKYIFH